MKKLLSILLLLSVFSVYAANNNILCSIEYFYSDDGMLIGKAINGNRINYEYDLRGQLLSVKDTNGKVLESYTYDKANQLISSIIETFIETKIHSVQDSVFTKYITRIEE